MGLAGLEPATSALSGLVKASSCVAPNRSRIAKWLVRRAEQGDHCDRLRSAETRSDGIVGTGKRPRTEQCATYEFCARQAEGSIVDYELPLRDDSRTITYRLVDFPFNPTTLTRTMSSSDRSEEAEAAARWVEQALFTRLTYARSLLQQLGAPTIDVADPRPGLVALGEWLQGWFPAVVAPFVQTSYPSEPGWWPKWIDVRSEDRLGDVWTDWPHQHLSYSELRDTVLHSLVVDITAVVMDCARHHGAGLGWVVRHEPRNGRFHLVVRPSTLPFAPLEQVRQLLVQCVGPTRGERSRSLRRRQSEFLVECFDQAVTGVVPDSTTSQFPENRYRMMSRFVLKRRPRSSAPAPVEVEEAVARLRAIGWYGSWKHSDEDLRRPYAQPGSWRPDAHCRPIQNGYGRAFFLSTPSERGSRTSTSDFEGLVTSSTTKRFSLYKASAGEVSVPSPIPRKTGAPLPRSSSSQ